MPSFHVTIKSGKPGKALEHFKYITRQDPNMAPIKREELVWCESMNLPTWTSDAGEFFDGSDKHERSNGAAYRELEFALPKELPLEKNIALTRRIAEEVLGPRPYVLAIHEKIGSISGERHPHAHAMSSDRSDDGITRTKETHFIRYNAANPERGGARKLSGGITPGEVFRKMRETRKQIATAINAALEEHGVLQRVDHRSLKERGIDRKAERPLGARRANTLTPEARTAILDARSSAANEGTSI